MKKIKIFFSSSKYPKFSNQISETSKKFFKDRIKNGDFKIESGGILEHFDKANSYTVFAHSGKAEDADEFQALGAKALRKAISIGGEKDLEIKISFETGFKKDLAFFVQKGALLAKQKDDFYVSEKKEQKISISGVSNKKLLDTVSAIETCRELTSRTSNDLDPEGLENFVKENLNKKELGLEVNYFGKKEIEKEKMGLFLAVNSGSKFEAKMITLDYAPNGKKEKPIVLIGKGLTYDSGGMYLKPYPYMNEMHGDMGGAATVLSAMSVLKKLGIKKRVVGIVGITENMVDANSYKNGDILTARNGKTVFVGHTDAEGRLVLADLLSYADDTFEPSLIFDFATLTGSCYFSLGEMYTGIFSDSKKLLEKVQKTGETVNDLAWPLPFDKLIKDSVKDKICDLSNTGSLKVLGASTAAAFLSNFVKDTKKWCHFDIAGTAMRAAQRRPYDLPNGIGSGGAVHLLLEFLGKN